MMPIGEQQAAFPAFLEESAEDLYEHAPCGYVSTLLDGTLVRVNQTFLDWTGYRREELVGRRRFQHLLAPGGRIYYETHVSPLLAMQGTLRGIAVDVVRTDGSRLPALVNATVRTDAEGGPAVVRTTVFDATDRREYERELVRARRRAEESEERARVLARTLQESLIPPAPLGIPGLRVAAAYRPAGKGDEVGGDFYDVFETARGDWAIVVGDVCGKGVEAATVTALARYTVRAAAMGARRPRLVLATLNEALLRDRSDRFCTVVYARVRHRGGGRFRLVVASGGHPLPLRVIGATGEVAEVGRPGTILGVVDSPALAEAAVDLGPGDVVVFYTDGVVEGRQGDEFYGEERVAALLAAHRESGAAAVAEALVEDVVAFQESLPRDDVAVVVLEVPPAR
jgi:sigma-B regulation protein RsbU (phosphoserine phosphatase)